MARRVFYIFFIFQMICIIWISPGWSQMTFDQAIQEGQTYGNTQPQGSGDANSLIQGAIQDGNIPGLTPEAQTNARAQGNFYLDNPGQLRLQGEGSLSTTPGGQFLGESYNLRPRFTIAPDDPLVVLSGNAAAGTEGCITQRICTQPTSTTITTTQQATCSIEYVEVPGQCTYDLPQPTTEWQPWIKLELVGQFGYWHFRLYVDTSGDGVYDLTLDNPSGSQNIKFFHVSGQAFSEDNYVYWTLGPDGTWQNATGFTSPPLDSNWWRVNVSGPYANRQSAAQYLKEVVRQGYGVPAAEVRMQAGSEWFGEGWCFALENDRCYSAVWERLQVIPPPPVSQETIQAACGAYMNEDCSLVNEQCTSTSCTRSYVCMDKTRLIDGCATYRDRGCTLESTSCALTNAYGQCLSQQETYICSTESIQEGCAAESVQVICPGSPDGIACLDDPSACADTTSTPSSDLNLAASNMQSLDAISKDHIPDPLMVYNGDEQQCRRTFASDVTRDCCALDTLLLGCNSQEELLQPRRNKGQCVDVGTYCSNRVNLLFTSVCVERTTSFCCFSSKLVRIIQEQGRPQLGLGWRTAQNPDCRGFTPEELQQIDFEAIDFSEYYSDIAANPPDPAQLTNQAQSSGALTPAPQNVPGTPSGINSGQVEQDIEEFYGTHLP